MANSTTPRAISTKNAPTPMAAISAAFDFLGVSNVGGTRSAFGAGFAACGVPAPVSALVFASTELCSVATETVGRTSVAGRFSASGEPSSSLEASGASSPSGEASPSSSASFTLSFAGSPSREPSSSLEAPSAPSFAGSLSEAATFSSVDAHSGTFSLTSSLSAAFAFSSAGVVSPWPRGCAASASWETP